MILSKLPNGLTLCLSSLVCAGVVVLQNAGSYANRLEPVVQAVSVDAFLAALPERLRVAGASSKAEELNALEIMSLSRLEFLAAMAWQRYMPAWEWGAELPAEPAAEQEPTLQPEESAALCEAVADAPTPEEEVVLVPERAPVAAPAASCWPVLSAALVRRSFHERFSDAAAHAEFYLARPQVAHEVPVPAAAAEEPAAELVSAAAAEEPAAELVSAAAAEESAAEPAAPAAEEPAAPAAEEPAAPVAEEPAAPAAEEPAAPAAEEPAAPVAEESAAPAAEEPAAPAAEEPALPPAPEAAVIPAVEEPEEQKDTPPQPEPETPPMRCCIMMVGDSLMEDLGPLTHRMMSHRKGLQFVISAKYSTGLCRPDYFDWPAHMREQVAKRKPDLVVFFIGANDGMPIKEGRKLVGTGDRAWIEAYMRKIDEMVGIAREAGADVIWVEMPAVGGRYNKELHENQKAQREYCETHGITTLRTDPFLSGEWGRFEPFGTYQGRMVRLRSKDVTHLTTSGNKKLLEYLMPIIERRLAAFYAAHPERHLSPEEAARLRKVSAIYTCKYTPPAKKVEEVPAAGQPSKP